MGQINCAPNHIVESIVESIRRTILLESKVETSWYEILDQFLSRKPIILKLNVSSAMKVVYLFVFYTI